MFDLLLADQVQAASRHLPGRRRVSLWQQPHKLLAADPRNEIPWTVSRQRQGARYLAQGFVAFDVAVVVVVLLEKIDIEDDQRQRQLAALGACPFALQHGVEHAAVGNASEAVLEGIFLQLFLEPNQVFFGLLALADIEHEADQRFDIIALAHHMHHIANPHVVTVYRQRAVIGLVVNAGARLRYAKVHHVLTVIRVHALDPVVHADPALWGPAQQRFDLRTDVSERHGLPIDAPGNGLGRLQQRFVYITVGQSWGIDAHGGLLWMMAKSQERLVNAV